MPALTAIRDCGLCVEVNTNGWYKPVQEVYPELPLLQACQKMGIPVTTGSDAHTPAQVGRDLDRARSLLVQAGYDQLTVFEKRRPRQVPLVVSGPVI
jgi:histidinol-phosphatase (PHP family)